MTKGLGLNGNRLLLYALIYSFSRDGESEFHGSISYICKWLNVTRKTAIDTLKSLVDAGLVEKGEIIENNIKSCTYKVVMQKIEEGWYKNYTGGGIKITPGGSVEFTPNNIEGDNIGDNKENIKRNGREEDKLETRQKKFYDSLIPFLDKYPKEMIRDFYDYWSEPNQTRTKMRYEMQATWETSRRLITWAKNNDKFKNNNNGRNRTNTEKFYDTIKSSSEFSKHLHEELERKQQQTAMGVGDNEPLW